MIWPTHYPVLGICGYSGSGKTTLVESLIKPLRDQGLAVAVIKHDAHGMVLDKPGKDTDRFFRAGATVFGHDPVQAFLRFRPPGDATLRTAVEHLLPTHDLIIVEGHKQTPLPAKIWLYAEDGGEPPTETGSWLLRLARDDNRTNMVLDFLNGWLANQMQKRPLRGGLLLGGASKRMGQPKQMMMYRGRTWAEWVVEALLSQVDELCLLGAGPVPKDLQRWPQLPDVPQRGGPLAGMLAAMRWDPEAAWIFLPCDMPLMTPVALAWLLDQRRPGCWAVLPRQPQGSEVEPLGAWYDPRLKAALAACRGPRGVVDRPGVETPIIPVEHVAAWRSFNTGDEADQLI